MDIASTHIDANGKVIAEYDDGDKGVYVHNNGTTKSQVDNQRQGGKYTGGDGNFIGELGGNIDITEIYSSILSDHSSEAESGFDYYIDNGDTYIRPNATSVLKMWVDLVKQGGDWDLKNNKSTIFGVAWAFDHSSKKGAKKTNFIAKNIAGNAADFGNHHAGYTGTKAGIPLLMQKVGAGMVEQLKMKNLLKTLFTTTQFFTAPYGDRQRDYRYNTLGMNHAKIK
jgi:hypothetical protein